jgi:ribosomal protein S27E
MDRNIIFKCPRTGLNVQHRVPASAAEPNATFVSVQCPACTFFHFIHPETGKVLGQK